ncbi:MAG: lysophospholipid acyltransferase family protein [Gammaproteobacteria bacterium]
MPLEAVRRAHVDFTLSPNRTDTPEYAGPHPWQIAPWARVVRRMMRHRAYTRWVDQYCRPLVVQGLSHLETLDGPFIIAANHQSHMDTLVLHEALPAWLQDNLFFGAAQDRWYIKGRRKLVLQPWYQSLVLGNFPIMRGGGFKAMDYAAWLLRQGACLAIFPEGTRATDGNLGAFRHGVARLALEQGVPVLPVYLDGLRALRPKGQLHVNPGPASAELLAPLRFAPGTSVADATDALYEALNTRHLEPRPIPVAAARAAQPGPRFVWPLGEVAHA